MARNTLKHPSCKMGSGVYEPVILWLLYEPIHELWLGVSYHNCLVLTCVYISLF